MITISVDYRPNIKCESVYFDIIVLYFKGNFLDIIVLYFKGNFKRFNK